MMGTDEKNHCPASMLVCSRSRRSPIFVACSFATRFAGSQYVMRGYERPAPFELVEPFLDRLGAPRDRTGFGHRLATTGYGDGLPCARMADETACTTRTPPHASSLRAHGR